MALRSLASSPGVGRDEPGAGVVALAEVPVVLAMAVGATRAGLGAVLVLNTPPAATAPTAIPASAIAAATATVVGLTVRPVRGAGDDGGDGAPKVGA